ncbi:MAG: protein phosphatase [Comamonadaceae bacterium]|nr:MAG: protein phosphatase [Comamonadaceae bacterium]
MTTSWQPNFDWIHTQLAVGGSFPGEQAPQLAAAHGIRNVIDLREEDSDDEALLLANGIALLHLPTPDMCGVAPEHLDHGVRFACDALDRGERVLVHCEYGIGRSATLALCILVRQGHAPLDALRTMKARRALVSPSPVQFDCWHAWLERYRKATPVDWSPPHFDDFQLIAYRPATAD